MRAAFPSEFSNYLVPMYNPLTNTYFSVTPNIFEHIQYHVRPNILLHNTKGRS